MERTITLGGTYLLASPDSDGESAILRLSKMRTHLPSDMRLFELPAVGLLQANGLLHGWRRCVCSVHIDLRRRILGAFHSR
jgi:hypothetical protein